MCRAAATAAAAATAVTVLVMLAAAATPVDRRNEILMNKNIFIWFLLVLTLVVAGGWAWSRYAKVSSPSTIYSTTNTPYSVLVQTNSDFLNGQNFVKTKNYSKAIESYQSALLTATDPVQKAQIEFKLAAAIAASGDPIAAIAMYKKLAANPENIPIMRAYSVQAISMLYYAGLDDSLTPEIFKGEPYKSFFVPGDTDLSYRQLFEYGSSFYPLAISELYIAGWYANSILDLYKTAPSSPQIAKYNTIIEEKFKNAMADIERIKPDPNENPIVPLAFLREAVVRGKLSYAGLTSPEQAEAAYKTALTTYEGFGLPAGTDGYARYYYALFLATTYGNKRATDIQTLLNPLYTAPGHSQYAIVSFFKNARMGDIRIKRTFQDLARFDPGFKAYLTSLGWKETDF